MAFRSRRGAIHAAMGQLSGMGRRAVPKNVIPWTLTAAMQSRIVLMTIQVVTVIACHSAAMGSGVRSEAASHMPLVVLTLVNSQECRMPPIAVVAAIAWAALVCLGVGRADTAAPETGAPVAEPSDALLWESTIARSASTGIGYRFFSLQLRPPETVVLRLAAIGDVQPPPQPTVLCLCRGSVPVSLECPRATTPDAPALELPTGVWQVLTLPNRSAGAAEATAATADGSADGELLELAFTCAGEALVDVMVAEAANPAALPLSQLLMIAGPHLQQQGKYQQALLTWRQYEDPNAETMEAARALLYQGDALKGLGNTEDALLTYRQALSFASGLVGSTDALASYAANRLAADFTDLVRSRLAGLVSSDTPSAADMSTLEDVAAAWPPTPAAKQASLRLAGWQVRNRDVSPQTIAYLASVFDAGGDHTTPHKTKLADNQPMLDRISTPTDRATLIEALTLLSELGPGYNLGRPLSADQTAAVADMWIEAERAALKDDMSRAPDGFARLAREYVGTLAAPLAVLAAGQWAHYTGRYVAARAHYARGAEAGGAATDGCLLGQAELALTCGDREEALGQLKEIVRSAADARIRDWANYRIAQCHEFRGEWRNAAALYGDLTHARDVGLADEARMALRRFESLGDVEPADEPSVRYLGEDRSTQGDWWTYHGSEAFILCAQQAPQDIAGGQVVEWLVEPACGDPTEKVRRWITGPSDEHPSMLYNPLSGVRRAANWDDRGEAHPPGTGPDLWVDVPVPAGRHRISLYFVNDHSYYEPRRVYTISVLGEDGRYLAGAEVRDFVNGVYEQFAATGPQLIKMHIARNLSLNVLLAGVFLDPRDAPSPDTGVLAAVGRSDAGRAWVSQRQAHISSTDERNALGHLVRDAERHEHPQDIDTFLDILARAELRSGRIGPAYWATETHLAAISGDQRYHQGMLRLYADRFGEPTRLRIPHTTSTVLAWPLVATIFATYLARVADVLPPDGQAAFYRRTIDDHDREFPDLAAIALKQLAELVGEDGLTPEEQLRAAQYAPSTNDGIKRVERLLGERPEGIDRASLQLRLVALYTTDAQVDKAEAVLKQMREDGAQQPQFPNALHILGTACLRSGEADRGRSYLSELIDGYPDSQWVPQARQQMGPGPITPATSN